MEIQVRSHSSPSAFKERPLRDPIAMITTGELALFHSDCGGHVSIDQEDPRDFDAYTNVRCNLCFETYREKRSSIVRDLTQVVGEGLPSSECTVLSFLPLSPKELLTHSPFAARLQHFLRGTRGH